MAGPLVDTLYRLRSTYEANGFQQANRDLAQFNGSVARAGEAASLLSNRFRTATVLATAGIGGAGKVFADTEKAAVTLMRVTGLQGGAFRRLLNDMRELAPQLGRTEQETLALAIQAARLGIAGGDLSRFVRTASMASTALDADLETTSTKLAKLRANFVLSVDGLNRLTGGIVALDEASAAAFPEILAAMTTVGPIARIMGVSGTQLAALSATIIETGLSAEVTGTALSQILQSIQKRSEQLGPLLGTTGEGLRRAFQRDQVGTVQRLAQAFVHLTSRGEDTSEFLRALNLDGRRATSVLTVLGSSVGRTGELMALANGEFQRGTLLQRAFGAMAQTLAHRWDVLKSSFLAAAARIGERLAPVLDRLMVALTGLFQAIQNSPLLQFAIGFGLLGAAILTAAGFLTFFVASQVIAFRTARQGMPFIIGEYHSLARAIRGVAVAQTAANVASAGLLGRASVVGRTAALGALGAGAGPFGRVMAYVGGAGGSFVTPLLTGMRGLVAVASRLAWPITIAAGAFMALKDNMFGARDGLAGMVRPFQQLFGGEARSSMANFLAIVQAISRVVGGIVGLVIRVTTTVLTPLFEAMAWWMDKVMSFANAVIGPIVDFLRWTGLAGGGGPEALEGTPRSGTGVPVYSSPTASTIMPVTAVPGSAAPQVVHNTISFPGMQVRSMDDVEKIRTVVRQELNRMPSEA